MALIVPQGVIVICSIPQTCAMLVAAGLSDCRLDDMSEDDR